MFWNNTQASVGMKPVPPPARKLSAVLHSKGENEALPAVVMSSIWSARAVAMRDAATRDFETIQRQLEYEIQTERSKLANN